MDIEREKTIRQEIIEQLLIRNFSAQELSKIVRVKEKEIKEHLEHLKLTFGKKFRVVSSECLKCGYIFKERNKVKSPGKCPECRGTHISDQEYYLET